MELGSDNRKLNLRMCTRGENGRNQLKQKGCSSKFKGVSWRDDRQKWQVKIKYKGKTSHIGIFKSEIEAAKAYDKKALELFGEFARTNLMMGLFEPSLSESAKLLSKLNEKLTSIFLNSFGE